MKRPHTRDYALFTIGLILFLVTACEEKPIVSGLVDIDFTVSDTVLYLDTAFTYRIPPDLGSLAYLYFGRTSEGYYTPYTLINFNAVSSDQSIHFQSLLDSTIISIDSLILTLTGFSEDIPAGLNFDLAWFDTGDSIFSESNSNYLNLDSILIRQRLADPVAGAGVRSDTSVSGGHPFLRFDLTASQQQILTRFADTSSGFSNRSFAVAATTAPDTIYSFFSRNSSANKPTLSVYYRASTEQDSLGNPLVDTLAQSFYPDRDLTVLYPPVVSTQDTSLLTLGRGKGLRGIFTIPFDSLSLVRGAVIKSAQLVFYTDSSSRHLDGFSVRLAAVDTTLTPVTEPLESDPYTTLGTIDNDQTTKGFIIFELRSYLQAVLAGQQENFGFKLTSNESNNPFQHIHLIRDASGGSGLIPRITIIYVAK